MLIALADGHHEHHALAARWFRTNASAGWKTCPLVETGFVRVLSSAALAPTITPQSAHEILGRFKGLPGYKFLPDNIDIHDDSFDIDSVRGTSQVTDAYLLALCRKNNLKLATFDRRIELALAPGEGLVEQL